MTLKPGQCTTEFRITMGIVGVGLVLVVVAVWKQEWIAAGIIFAAKALAAGYYSNSRGLAKTATPFDWRAFLTSLPEDKRARPPRSDSGPRDSQKPSAVK